MIPTPAGVPEITPVAEFKVRPCGSAPEAIDQVYGETPPVAVRVCEYGTLSWPFGSELVEMTTAVVCAVTVMPNWALAVSPAASVTVTVKVLAPVAVGVPLMEPEPVFNASPTGKAPDEMDQVYG